VPRILPNVVEYDQTYHNAITYKSCLC